MKYNIKDFEKVANGKASVEEMSELYCVSREAFIRAMNKKGYYLNKTKIKIISPNKTKIVYSYSACADELKVSIETIRNALKGKRVKTFEDLGIKVEVMKR